jgi:PleD family two-component response regulator
MHSELDNKPVTVRIGMCSHEAGLEEESFFKAADDRLYRAKMNRRTHTAIAKYLKYPFQRS